MAMTKKDYELVASAIAMLNRATTEHLNEETSEDEKTFLRGVLRGLELTTNQLRWSFAIETKSNFDSVKFEKACGFDYN